MADTRVGKDVAILVLLLVSLIGMVHAADNLRLNPKLDYSSDSNDGPLISGELGFF